MCPPPKHLIEYALPSGVHRNSLISAAQGKSEIFQSWIFRIGLLRSTSFQSVRMSKINCTKYQDQKVDVHRISHFQGLFKKQVLFFLNFRDSANKSYSLKSYIWFVCLKSVACTEGCFLVAQSPPPPRLQDTQTPF